MHRIRRHRTSVLVVLAVLLSACPPPDDGRNVVGGSGWNNGVSPETDLDGDGFPGRSDCDDFNSNVFPGAAERCGNGRDDDCNRRTDCDDAACAEEAACAPDPQVENCLDGRDNDGDTIIDCADEDCRLGRACSPCFILFSGGCGQNWDDFTPFIYAYPRIANWQGRCGRSEPGGEVVVEFIPDRDTTVDVTVTPRGDGDGLRLYYSESACHPELCSALSDEPGPEAVQTLRFDATAFSYHYIIIEGLDAADLPYAMVTTCE